jgi:hypothetical protein
VAYRRIVRSGGIFYHQTFPGAKWAKLSRKRSLYQRTLLPKSRPLHVLARKFSKGPEELARTAIFLSELTELVVPRKKLAVLDDEPDNRILECAVLTPLVLEKLGFSLLTGGHFLVPSDFTNACHSSPAKRAPRAAPSPNLLCPLRCSRCTKSRARLVNAQCSYASA